VRGRIEVEVEVAKVWFRKLRNVSRMEGCLRRRFVGVEGWIIYIVVELTDLWLEAYC
jgi:hypothetical protein